MRIVFFGTPQFAAETLASLIDRGVSITAVVSKPDRPKGRSQKTAPTPVRTVAEEKGILLYQPERASDPAFAEKLEALRPDLFVVVAYGEILKENLLEMPKLGCINLHTSLLPKYRGAAPVQRAVIAGERKSGVSIIYMAKKMDAGDLIKSVETPVGQNETFGELESRLQAIGSEALFDVIGMFKKGRPKGAPQDEAEATFAGKIELEDCKIDWTLPAEQLHNLVRGVNPYPAAWCRALLKGEEKRFKIYRTEPVPHLEGPPGTLLEGPGKGELSVACGEGALKLLLVQLEGKKTMPAEALMRGIPPGSLKLL